MAHQVLHDTLALSSSFAVALALTAMAVVAIGLLASRAGRLSAASRHFILSTAFLLPVVAAIVIASGAGEVLRSFAPQPLPPPTVTVASPLTVAPVPAAANRSSEVPCVLFVIWSAGALILLGRSSRQWIYWARVARNGRNTSDPTLLTALVETAGDDAYPRLAVSSAASEPMVVGVIRPTIILPAGYGQSLERRELLAVFAHELEHVRRRDNLTAAVSEIVWTLFWFSPFHWLARRRLLELRERACDQAVLARGYDAEPYVAALAKTCHAAIESPAVACVSGFHVRERIESIMSYATTRFVSERKVQIIAVITAVALLAGFATLIPAPAIASPVADAYDFNVRFQPAGDGKIRVSVSVRSPNGELLMSSQATAVAGQTVQLSTSQGGRTYSVDVTPAPDGSGLATLEVRDGGEIVHRSSRSIASPAGMVHFPSAEPITLDLKDADLHDVLRTFAQLTGRRIIAEPSLTGKITISVENTPWDIALTRALAPLGLVPEFEGQQIRIERARGYRVLQPGEPRPRVLSRVEPIWPEAAREARISGMVVLEVVVDETGTVRRTRVLKPLPFGLHDAAADAVRQWRFEPFRDETGTPVPVMFNTTVNFRSQ